jgi:predicted permease
VPDLRFWHWRRREDDELDRELEVHLALEVEEQLERGVPLRDAQLAAHRAFGSVALTKEELRDMRASAAFERLWQDVRYALRLMRRSPGFTAVAVVTLTLAVAANSAIFSVVQGILLNPLAYRDSARLVAISEVNPRPGAAQPSVPVAGVHFLEWRESSASFDGLSLLNGCNFELTGSGEPEMVSGACVSSSLFSVLGVSMQRGRAFVPEDEQPGRDQVVVLSDDLWRRRFGGDPRVIGRTIVVGGSAHEVVGVLPAGFGFPLISQLYPVQLFASRDHPQMWKPLTLASFERVPRLPVFNYAVIGRLRPGVSAVQATSDLNVLQKRIAALTANGLEYPVSIMPLQERITGGFRSGLILMWAAVGAVLLISCVNVANLLLARGARRRREMAVRSALGASRGRIARQTLVESLVLSIASGVLGLLGAYALIRLIVASAPGDLPRLDEVHLDAGVLIFTFAIVLVDGILFGVLPAWRSSRTDPQDAMRADSRSATTGRQGVRLRAVLVSIEVGICVVCLIVGALLLESFSRVLDVQQGFDIDHVLTVDVSLPVARYPMLGPAATRRQAFLRSALERAQALPGVTTVGISNMLPLAGEGPGMAVFLDGLVEQPSERPTARIRAVNADYFRTMGIPIKDGRVFRDDDATRSVAVISSVTANRLWPSERVIGKQFRVRGENGPLLEVVGVVGDVRTASLTSDAPLTIYLPYWQSLIPVPKWSLAAKTADPVGTAGLLRAAIRDLDSQLPIPAFRTMDEIMTGSLSQRRFQLNIVLLFAGAGLFLATIGIYGVVSYSVAQRTNEIGIRMALGAPAGAIQALVIRQGLLPLIPGVMIGIAVSLAAQRLLSGLLFGVSAHDPLTMGAVALLLVTVAVAASYVPARRATRVSPVSALRYE